MEKLRRVGLSEYEAKSYIALLRFGAQMGREVAKRSGVPPTRVFDVLKSLRDKGLVNLIQEKPMVWVAVRPEIGLKGFADKKIDDIKNLETSVLSSLKQIRPESTQPKIHERVIVASGYQKLYGLAVQYLKLCKKEYFVYSVGEKIPFKLRVESKRAIKRGVELRLIVTKYDEENKYIVEERVRDGWKVRYVPGSSEFTFAVYDGKVTLINVRNPNIKEERISVIFENSELSKAFVEYYNVLWKKAKPINV